MVALLAARREQGPHPLGGLKPAFGQDDKFGGTQSGTCVIDYQNVSGAGDGQHPVMIAFWSRPGQPAAVHLLQQRPRPHLDQVRQESGARASLPRPQGLLARAEPQVDHGPLRAPQLQLLHFHLVEPAAVARAKHGSRTCTSAPTCSRFRWTATPRKTKWVVVNGDGKYKVGDFDGLQFTSASAKKRCEWGRNFYATQTWNNMPKDRPAADPGRLDERRQVPKMPFNQQWSFPCELTLHTQADGPAPLPLSDPRDRKLWAEEDRLGPLTLKPGDDPLAGLASKYDDIDLEIDLGRSDASEIVFELAGNQVRYS